MSKFTTSFAALAAVVALSAGAAHAGEGLSIRYDDLDLSRPSEALTFQQRVDKAAKSWCRKEPLRTGTRIKDISACKARAAQAVVEQMPKARAAAYLAALKQTDAALYAERDAQARRQ